MGLMAGLLGIAIGVMSTVSIAELIVKNLLENDAFLVLMSTTLGALVRHDLSQQLILQIMRDIMIPVKCLCPRWKPEGGSSLQSQVYYVFEPLIPKGAESHDHHNIEVRLF